MTARGYAIVLKVSEECNLRCTYCYEYVGKYARAPLGGHKRMSRETISLLIERILEHRQRYPEDSFTVALHGGEPLLWGLSHLDWSLNCLRDAIPDLRLAIQTNGVLLSERHLALFSSVGASVSISTDGPNIYQQNRVTRGHAQPVSEQIDRSIRLILESAPHLFGGVLVVADLDTEPAPILSYLQDLGVRDCDFLLPIASRELALDEIVELNSKATVYLHSLLDAWMAIGFDNLRLRWFLELATSRHFANAGQVYGHKLDSLGGNLSQVLTLETNGDLWDVDVNRMLGPKRVSAAKLSTTSIYEYGNAISSHYGATCASSCRECEFFEMCGGGYVPHRFDGISIDHPTVYCDTMKQICARVAELVH
jgi:uncharacterized protein